MSAQLTSKFEKLSVIVFVYSFCSDGHTSYFPIKIIDESSVPKKSKLPFGMDFMLAGSCLNSVSENFSTDEAYHMELAA